MLYCFCSLPEKLEKGVVEVDSSNPVLEGTGGEGNEADPLETPYIPMEIIRFESITGISTLSVNKTSGKAFLQQIESAVYEKARQAYNVSVTQDDSSGTTPTNSPNVGAPAPAAPKPADSVADQMAHLFVSPPSTDYVPNQYGSYSGSSYTSSTMSYSSSQKASTQSTDSKPKH